MRRGGLADRGGELGVDVVAGTLDWGGKGAQTGQGGGEGGMQQAVAGAGEEESDAQAEVGDAMAEAVRHALDRAVETQAAQLTGGGALGDRLRMAGRQSRKVVAQVGGAEALRELPEQDEGLQQRAEAGVGEAQARGALAPCRDRIGDGLEGVLGEYAVVAEAFDLDEAALGRKADGAQRGRLHRGLPTPKSRGLSMVVSVRSARLSLWYCSMRVFL
jgi:hypothetical protein